METLVCKACWTEIFNTEAIQKFWAQESYDFCYNTTWARVVLSGQNGCNWCGFLTAVLPFPNTPQWPSIWTPATDLLVILDKVDFENSSPRGLNQCQLDFSSEGSSRDWHVELDLFVDDPAESAGIVTARASQSRINSAEAYSQILQWLDQCRNHMGCSEGPLYANLPSRVIEVAPADSPGVPRLRSTTGRKGSYLALSYCWGSKQSYVLTTGNLASLLRELEVNMLPQTILDAIEVSKNLGFEYLWVDALCILQDSTKAAARQDMDQELAMMGQIYTNATMTIVAACTPSATGGFLHDRPRPGQRQFDIPCRLSQEQFVAVHIQEHIMYDDKIEPINTRAWTFQEGLLSARLLIYASHTLQWQCRTLTCNLGGSYHAPSPSAVPRLPSPQILLLEGLEQNPRRGQLWPDIPHPILQHWLRVLINYSVRKSSLPSDKLPALSALAASYGAVFGPEYFAGIWARSAVQQLCWRSPDSRITFTRPTGYRAPSWSWAALDGPVYFPSFIQINNASICVPYHRFEIIEWQTRLKAPNLSYGEVTAGKLIVTTVIRDATLDPANSPTIRFDTARNLDLHDLETAPSSATPRMMQTAESNSDTVEDNFTRPVRCLAMYCSNGPEPRPVCGLVLVELTGQKGVHRRIGWFSADVSVFKDYPLDTVSIV